MNKLFVFFFLLCVIVIAGCAQDTQKRVTIETKDTDTFTDSGDEVCKDEQGRPIIREFSTSWCPHCQWVKETFKKVVDEYAAAGKIIAYQWEVDTNDNLLTGNQESSVPEIELEVFRKFNPAESIPTFIFGCKYVRIGNGYEVQGDLAAEEAEFKAVIEKLVE